MSATGAGGYPAAHPARHAGSFPLDPSAFPVRFNLFDGSADNDMEAGRMESSAPAMTARSRREIMDGRGNLCGKSVAGTLLLVGCLLTGCSTGGGNQFTLFPEGHRLIPQAKD